MFLLSYFRSDFNPATRNESEALHYALSRDGYRWTVLNGDRAVLRGTVGSKSLRDPFVARAEDGRYHFFATNDWRSTSIVHAWSEDLLNWRDQRLLPVMGHVPGAKNAWAPECFYDQEHQLYRIIWSSAAGLHTNADDLDHRIWGCSTRDFVDFTPAQLFFDPGYSVIDATVLRHGGQYLMAFKDERGENNFTQHWKAIRVTRSAAATGPWAEPSPLITPALTEGPTLYRTGDGLVLLFDHFMEGVLGALRSVDGAQWEPVTQAMAFPLKPNHASVMKIDQATGRHLAEQLLTGECANQIQALLE